jgi:hypothetical protein
MRTWRLPSPVKVVDKLKSVLLGEMTSAEWELLEENEWDDHGVQAQDRNGEEPVLVAAKWSAAKSLDDTGGVVASGEENTQVAHSRGSDDLVGGSRPKGTSGWTKVKSR